jgi:hypothetical protein
MQRAHVFDRHQPFAKLLPDLKEELSQPELVDAQVGKRSIRHKLDRRAHNVLAHRPDLVDVGRRQLLGWSCCAVHLFAGRLLCTHADGAPLSRTQDRMSRLFHAARGLNIEVLRILKVQLWV